MNNKVHYKKDFLFIAFSFTFCAFYPLLFAHFMGPKTNIATKIIHCIGDKFQLRALEYPPVSRTAATTPPLPWLWWSSMPDAAPLELNGSVKQLTVALGCFHHSHKV